MAKNLVISAGSVYVGTVSTGNINWGNANSTVTLANNTALYVNGSSSGHHTVASNLVLGETSNDMSTSIGLMQVRQISMILAINLQVM
jgi:hypothetical protein